MQHIDTTNDYMQLIYKFVVEKNTPKPSNPFDIVRRDYKEFSIPYLDENGEFLLEERIKCNDIDEWLNEYICCLSDSQKQELYTYYGYVRLLSEMPEMLKFNCFGSYEQMLKAFQDEENDYPPFTVSYNLEQAMFGYMFYKEVPEINKHIAWIYSVQDSR